MIKISKVKPEEFPLLIQLVKKLLIELVDEAEDIKKMDDEVLNRELKNNSSHHAFFARNENNEIVGCLTVVESYSIYAPGKTCIINELYVVPEYRSMNVGAELIQTIKIFAKENNIKRIDVTAPVGDEWRRTISFYEKNGFVFTGPKLKLIL